MWAVGWWSLEVIAGAGHSLHPNGSAISRGAAEHAELGRGVFDTAHTELDRDVALEWHMLRVLRGSATIVGRDAPT
jgi:hypothetical protein